MTTEERLLQGLRTIHEYTGANRHPNGTWDSHVISGRLLRGEDQNGTANQCSAQKGATTSADLSVAEKALARELYEFKHSSTNSAGDVVMALREVFRSTYLCCVCNRLPKEAGFKACTVCLDGIGVDRKTGFAGINGSATLSPRCGFGGDYGQCELEDGHDGRHRITSSHSATVPHE